MVKVNDVVATEVPCGTHHNGSFNINGSTTIKGIVTNIEGDSVELVITEPSPCETPLEVGQTHRMMIAQCWKI